MIKHGRTVQPAHEACEEWISEEVEFSLYVDDVLGYLIGYSHVDVGLVSYVSFETLSDAYDWLEEQGAEYVPR